MNSALPVRSAVLKQDTGRLVVRWVTTSESPLLYVFVLFAQGFKCKPEMRLRNLHHSRRWIWQPGALHVRPAYVVHPYFTSPHCIRIHVLLSFAPGLADRQSYAAVSGQGFLLYMRRSSQVNVTMTTSVRFWLEVSSFWYPGERIGVPCSPICTKRRMKQDAGELPIQLRSHGGRPFS